MFCIIQKKMEKNENGRRSFDDCFTSLYYNPETTTFDLPILEVKTYKTTQYFYYEADMEGPPHSLQVLWEKVPVSGK